MINELTILQSLQTTIQTHLNEYLKPGVVEISDKNVVMDFPDTDLMPDSKMFYIVPDYVNYENFATTNDRSQFRISVFIVCKRNTAENLTVQVFNYYMALYQLIRENMTLNGVVDFTAVMSMDYIPAVDLNKNVQGMEVSLAAEYTKDF